MMRTCVIMQPTFLPWAGYFNLMLQADDFVFLDDVQLEKQSWQTRNRLIVNGEVKWISLPVRHLSHEQKIYKTELHPVFNWKDKLIRTFEMNYSRHPHYQAARKIIDLIATSTSTNLASINKTIIASIASHLELKTRLHSSSELTVNGTRSARLLSICKHLNADEYLSPLGSEGYLVKDQFDQNTSVTLRFQNYEPLHYSQKNSAQFISKLSILDVISNIGWEATRLYILNKDMP